MTLLYRFLAILTLAVFLVLAPNATAGDSDETIMGRRQSGLPPVGYSDTALIPGQNWRVHDINRPEPPIVSPGTASTVDKAGRAPSDAIVLFDGTDLLQWTAGDGKSEAKWKIENGYMEVNKTGSIKTKDGFGSCQLHVEFATPTEPKGESQGRGNSGVFLMGNYEVQILDSFENRTYSDGQASAIYGQYPPLVNASRGPGKWQTYDIIFEAPKFEDKELVEPATLTVLHNGVVVHLRTKLAGKSGHKNPAKWQPHGDKLPIQLQDHGNPTRFRNIWIRPLTGYDEGR